MLPWQERKPRQDGGYSVDEVLHGKVDEPEEESSLDVHKIALRGVAHDMLNAIKNGDAERLSSALDLLCEVCISGYDKD